MNIESFIVTRRCLWLPTRLTRLLLPLATYINYMIVYYEMWTTSNAWCIYKQMRRVLRLFPLPANDNSPIRPFYQWRLRGWASISPHSYFVRYTVSSIRCTTPKYRENVEYSTMLCTQNIQCTALSVYSMQNEELKSEGRKCNLKKKNQSMYLQRTQCDFV